jgi:hypothetical protein
MVSFERLMLKLGRKKLASDGNGDQTKDGKKAKQKVARAAKNAVGTPDAQSIPSDNTNVEEYIPELQVLPVPDPQAQYMVVLQ